MRAPMIRVSAFNRVRGVFAQVLLVLLVPNLCAAALPQVEFDNLRFFEGPSNRPTDPDYRRIFSSDARYIWCNLQVDNKLHNQRDNPVNFRLRYYNPDGSFRGESTVSYTIPSNWTSVYLYGGWGNSSGSSWAPGEYRVEAYYFDENGEFESFDPRYELLVAQFFKVAANPATETIAPDPTFSLYRTRFFEGSSPAPSPSERIFSDIFPQTKARRIWTELATINHLYGIERNQPRLQLDYYRPDGTHYGASTLNMNADPSWLRVLSVAGWGWGDDPGNWQPGPYTVVVRQDGRHLGEGMFTIEDDRPVSLNYAVVNVRFFAVVSSGSRAPGSERSFSASATSKVEVEFEVENPNHGVRPHQIELEVELFRWEEGHERSIQKQKISRAFSATDRSARVSTMLELDGEGTSKPGRYGVRIRLEERTLNLDYFALK